MKSPPDAEIRGLFAAHADALLLYARQWVDGSQTQDVVQEVFLRLMASGRLPTEPRTWLYRCVRNAAISAWRSNRRRGRRERQAALDEWFVPRPEDKLDAASAQEALRALPPVQREVVTLRVWSGLTLAQIAEVTGLAVSNVHHQYRLGLKTMRERLEQSCRNRNP